MNKTATTISETPPKVLIIARFNAWIPPRPEVIMIQRLFKREVNIEILTNVRSAHAKSFEEAGIKVHYGHPGSKVSIKHIMRIRKLLKQGGFDILHLFNSRAISNGLLAATGLKVKVVTYRGSGDLHWHDPTAYLTHLNPRVDVISCLSNYVKAQVDKQFWFRKKKTVVHSKGFLPEWFDNIVPIDLGQFGIPTGSVVGACAANYRRVKGIEYLIRATALLGHHHNFHLLIIGRGMDHPQLQKLVNQSPMRQRIHFAGYRDDIYECIKACDIYIQPSLNEGLSRSVVEAMAQAVPCVVSNVGGLPELVDHLYTGLLVPAADPEALAGGISNLVSDAELRTRLGNNARKRLFEKYSMEKYTNKIHQMYLDLKEDQ